MMAMPQVSVRLAPDPIVVTHCGGAQFSARVGRHDLTLDQPPAGGGEDAGPSPIELLGAALGSCVALYVHRFLTGRGIADEGLAVEVVQHAVRGPHRISRFEVRVVLPLGVPPRYRALVEAVARSCPVHNTLSRGAEIAIAVEA
jgi:uncharacterized OsmC-like protein